MTIRQIEQQIDESDADGIDAMTAPHAAAKVVINVCFGGFSLSHVAALRYAELRGWALRWEPLMKSFADRPPEDGWNSYFVTIPGETEAHWSNRDIWREDITLIQVVEELDAAANGRCAELTIVEVPFGERYRIDEYDGRESIMTIEDYEWQIAGQEPTS